MGQADQVVTVKLSAEERVLILAVGVLVEQGRPAGETFTSRGLAGWLPQTLPRHLRSERAVGPVLDLLGCEPNPRTSRRATAALRDVIADWVALAQEQEARELDAPAMFPDFQ